MIRTEDVNAIVHVCIDAFRRGPFVYVPERIDWDTCQHECE
jgi:hypothetical protein